MFFRALAVLDLDCWLLQSSENDKALLGYSLFIYCPASPNMSHEQQLPHKIMLIARKHF
jgi:hypothetical protein